TFRRRGKLLLTLGLLTAAGSMFMTALNVKAGWNRNLADSFASRQYDFEIRLSRPESAEKCTSLIREIPGVKTAEAWGFAPASGAQHDGFDLNHTYPDGGHGSLTLKGVPDGSTLVRFPVLSGRWLKQGDTDAVVLNQLAVAQLLNPSVGATVSLTVNGKLRTWRVAGIVKELGPASAYVTEKSFEERVTVPGYATSLRVVTADKTLEERARVIHGIEEALKSANIGISMVIADAEFRDAISDHIFILIFSLVAMAGLMTVVGMLGLTSTMSTNVLERTREFGVMRAIGGTPATVFRNIISEAVFIGMLSIVGAVALSMPLSYAVGKLIGTLTFKTPLPMEISFHGIVIWIGIVVIGSVVSSAFPAWRASRMTVRETLVYE
ncbi:MAG TPA: ABC transporter permease, partial [Spirochaetota bacterium]